MRKVLFISTNDHVPWGGSEVLWSGAAAGLASLGGTEVMASVWDWEPEPAGITALRAAGVRMHKRYQRTVELDRWRKAHRIWRKGWSWEVVENPFEAVAVMRPDLVVFSIGDHLCPTFVRIAEHLRAKGIPYAVVVQLVNEYRYPVDEYLLRVREAYLGAERLWFVSEQNRHLAVRHLATELPKAALVDNPLDISMEDLQYPSTAEGFHLTMVASLNRMHKGQDLVFDVLKERKWKERHLYLNLYGDGLCRDALLRLKARWGLERVVFMGHEPDKRVIWARSHAALFASRMEGRSLALLEAMAHGRMVISTDVGGARDLIEDGRSGYLVPYPDASALDTVLERAWAERERWAGMGASAHLSVMRAIPEDPVQRFTGLVRDLANGLPAK